MGFQSAELDNESDEDAVAAFEQVVRDWGDLLDELEPLHGVMQRNHLMQRSQSCGTVVSR